MADGPFPCSGKTDLFFPERGASSRDIKRAKELCMSCSYSESCEQGAVARGERFGIWNGKTDRELRAARRRSAYAGAPRLRDFAHLPVRNRVSA